MEEEFPVLERLASFLFLVGDGFLRDTAVRVGLRQVLEADLGFRSVQARLAVLVQHGTAEGVDRLGSVHGEAFVLLELARVAADVVGLGDGAHLHHLVPGLGRSGDEVLAVVEDAAIGRYRCRVESALVRAGLNGGLQHALGVNRHLVLQRLEPALGGKLSRPDNIDAGNVIVGVLCLVILDQVVVLLVGGVSLFLERDLLVRVCGVPFFNEGTDDVAVVLALDVGDGATAVEALFSVAAATPARSAASATTGGKC
ncbi:hypothetical protein D9M72_374740 [compost metagenome]